MPMCSCEYWRLPGSASLSQAGTALASSGLAKEHARKAFVVLTLSGSSPLMVFMSCFAASSSCRLQFCIVLGPAGSRMASGEAIPLSFRASKASSIGSRCLTLAYLCLPTRIWSEKAAARRA